MARDVTLLIKLQDQVSRKLSKINQGAKRLEKAFNKNGKAAQRMTAGSLHHVQADRFQARESASE